MSSVSNSVPCIVGRVGGLTSPLFACRVHLPDDVHQRAILQGGCNPLLVSELLIDGFVRAMCAFLDADVDPEARR